MKAIKINKEFTEKWTIEQVKADAKEFQNSTTYEDIMCAFRSQTNWNDRYDSIVKIDIDAMDAGSFYGNKTIFCVEALLESFDTYYKVRFYIDMDMNVDTRTVANGADIDMYNVRKFVLA